MRFLPVLFYASILLIVGLWLRPLLRDLRVLTVASQKFATDYREPLDTASRTTQLTSLATNLDDMSARVSQLIQSQKEMTAALSHEMRTPLARVRFAAAVLEGEVDEPLRGQLRAVNADVQQIDDLISDMLDYARLDHPGLRMNCQTIPLAPWLRQVVASVSAASRRPSAPSQHDGIETAWMEPRLMELALSNLLANALRYARQKVTITVMRERRSVSPGGRGRRRRNSRGRPRDDLSRVHAARYQPQPRHRRIRTGPRDRRAHRGAAPRPRGRRKPARASAVRSSRWSGRRSRRMAACPSPSSAR